MKLLILPSHKLMLYLGKFSLALLPQAILAEQYATINHNAHHHNSQQVDLGYVALMHYKTVSIYKYADIYALALNGSKENIKALISQYFPKKVQVLDFYTTTHSNHNTISRQCIISDKFGDIYKIHLDPVLTNNQNKEIKQNSHAPIYINSNLGIPKYIKHISLAHLPGVHKYKQYLILGDEQNRIKVYNSLNPHQLISVWFMINMYSIQCHVLHNYNHQDKLADNNNHNYPTIVLLLKYFNKITLESSVELHYFVASPQNLEAQEYPGIKINSNQEFYYKENFKICKYFTTLQMKTNHKGEHSGNAILLLYLYEEKIIYEYFIIENAAGSHKVSIDPKFAGEIAIEKGNWDYLYGIDTEQSNTVILAYGTDVEIPAQIQIGEGNQIYFSETEKISLNKYEKVIKFQLPAL